jgi:hypothetical protein
MAFNRKYFNLFKYLLPTGNAFSITIQKYLTNLFEGLTALPDDERQYIDDIYFDLFPCCTRSPELWENQFGIRNPSSDDTVRRNEIDTNWKLKGGQSAYYLETTLNNAGFAVQVHENNPKTDPDNFISALFVMTCGMTTAVCGNDAAYAGKTGGYILANGFIPITSDQRDFLMTCGGDGFDNVTCGQTVAVCGYFEQFIVNPKIYEIPDDDAYWNHVFFIGGDATRDPVTHKLTAIETVTLSASRRQEFEKLILKIKGTHLWAGMMIDYV